MKILSEQMITRYQQPHVVRRAAPSAPRQCLRRGWLRPIEAIIRALTRPRHLSSV
ncbi:MAG TPA: hypothetical protein PKA95_11300 [Thermomicrobiales bacterium]|nr:hypothetical protein [Thermomicrobiales bacterium]